MTIPANQFGNAVRGHWPDVQPCRPARPWDAGPMRARGLWAVLVLGGCFEEAGPAADDGIVLEDGVDDEGTEGDAGSSETESSDGEEAVPWGPCETDEDCPSFPIPYDNGTSTQNCQFGTCVYHCPSDGNPNFCPSAAAGTQYEDVPYFSICQQGYCPMPMVVNENCVGQCMHDPPTATTNCEEWCMEIYDAVCPEGATLYQGGWGYACFWDPPV